MMTIELKLGFMAPGEFGGVRSFAGDDGINRRMWTINYLGGKINGFFGSSSEDDQLFKILESVPAGTPARAFGSVDCSGVDELKLVASTFTMEGAEGFKPLEPAEVLGGCQFSGSLLCWKKEVRRDGSFNARFSSIGSNFQVRDITQEIFDRLEENQTFSLRGSLVTDLVFKGVSRVPSVGCRLVLKSVKPINLIKTDKN